VLSRHQDCAAVLADPAFGHAPASRPPSPCATCCPSSLTARLARR
jgi:hypothetical protein